MREHYLIERILNLHQFLQDNGLDMDQLAPGQDAPSALAEREELQSAWEALRFMDEMPGGFLIYYAGGREQIIYANRALLRIFQCDSMAQFRALTKNSFRGMVHPEDLEEVERSIQAQVISSPHDLDYVEYRILRRDGTVRWVEDYGHFVHSEAFPDIFYVFLGDATEKRDQLLAERASLIQEKCQKEQRLQTLIQEYDRERTLLNQEHLRRLEVIEGLSVDFESIFYADLDEDQALPYRLGFHSSLVFDEKYRMRRFSELMASYMGTTVHPDDRELFARSTSRDGIRERLADSKSFYTNFRIVRGAEVKYFQVRIVNVGRQDRVSQIVMGFRSVEEELRHEMEQKQMLAEALSNATQASSAKNVFLSNMSHDMRTPLNAIFGFTTLARRDCRDPEAVEGWLDRIDASSRQLLSLIERVLELSQQKSSRDHIEVECDLCSTVEEIYQFLLPQAEEKDIDFTLDCTGVAHRAIYGDEEKLKQLMLYLMNNAVTYTKPGGRVSVTVAERELLPSQCAVYQLVVEDTGIGISEEFLTKVFEPFTREKNTTLSGIHGIGLGLTITKNIVDMMDGSIDVRSAVGKGSTFTVTLHFRVQDRLVPAAGADGPGAGHKVQNILLVEDNEINQEIESEILSGLGFSVDVAEDGAKAVEKVRSAPAGRYDLVLMDIQMPVMDGWQAAWAIRQMDDIAKARIPIIALSANVFDSDVRKSVEHGINAHIPKPLDVGVLMETIERIVGKG